ncbi:isoaspartyl dipeptidase [Vibrio cidicii]|uniref:Isoaspartyl dipeptidase n=1 Tax=Vibrio cidicii TaxID=1763883 RepID=A0A151L1I4_9VIBR|nr:beta-aspartyl-peptidase [Vibrio cidicii]KYN90151.1 isoaspartyl dipeptidase [Vibrio cidicii]
MIRLLTNVELYAPQYLGIKHVLIADSKIAAIIPPDALPELGPFIQVIDLKGDRLVPGFVDGLVHYCGGGGEGGFANRTPELLANEAAKAGVTTVVGALGTDSLTRTLSNLLGKCRELQAQGLSAYFYSGSYHIPLKTLTGSLESDLMFIPEILGVGELALSDHRASVLTLNDLVEIGKKTKTYASLASKKGVIFCHLGDSPEQLSLLRDVIAHSDLTHQHFIPTHCNRNPDLFEDALQYGLEGGYIDFTTSTTQGLLDDGEVLSARAIKLALDAGIDPRLITLSSDANASLPRFDQHGNTVGVEAGRISSLFASVKQAHEQYAVPFDIALSCITQNPASALGLSSKGSIQEGADADLVVLSPDTLDIKTVWSKGQIIHDCRTSLY